MRGLQIIYGYYWEYEPEFGPEKPPPEGDPSFGKKLKIACVGCLYTLYFRIILNSGQLTVV
ncbi:MULTISPECIES: hypothetical protein [Aerosakkonema]|uniref:hypothetical protein n=1 Tax=Aerosakkonema TaxID=1246629 RepID=UPI0035B92728